MTETDKERDSDFVTLDDETPPPVVKSADGSTDLHRFEVKAIIYATDRDDVKSRISRWNLGAVLDAAVIEE